MFAKLQKETQLMGGGGGGGRGRSKQETGAVVLFSQEDVVNNGKVWCTKGEITMTGPF